MRQYMKKPWQLAAAGLLGGGLLALILAGCATIMQGTTQHVGISSTPTSAKVLIDNAPAGQTPVVSKLSRKDNHTVRLTMDGYLPYETTLSRGVSGWVWGNIVFGGIVGLAVDAISGGLYKLTPTQVQAEMKKEGTAFRLEKDQLLISVVMRPDPSWERIDSLKPINRP